MCLVLACSKLLFAPGVEVKHALPGFFSSDWSFLIILQLQPVAGDSQGWLSGGIQRQGLQRGTNSPDPKVVQ